MSTPTDKLTDHFISDTYEGILHAFGQEIPDSIRVPIYDGKGNKTAISLGRANAPGGVTISNGLTVGALSYPAVASTNGSVVIQTSTTSLGLVTSLPGSILAPITSGAGGTVYNNVQSITVTPQGLVSNVTKAGPNTITSTTYFDSAVNPEGLLTIPSGGSTGWIEVPLEHYGGAKGGIFFIRPTSGRDVSSDFAYTVWASPNASRSFPVYTFHGDDDDEALIGVQFQCPLNSDNLGSNVIYFRRDLASGSPNLPTVTYQILRVARQD